MISPSADKDSPPLGQQCNFLKEVLRQSPKNHLREQKQCDTFQYLNTSNRCFFVLAINAVEKYVHDRE